MIILARPKSGQIILIGQMKSNCISVMEVGVAGAVVGVVALLVHVAVGVAVQNGDCHALFLWHGSIVARVILPSVEGKSACGFK